MFTAQSVSGQEDNYENSPEADTRRFTPKPASLAKMSDRVS